MVFGKFAGFFEAAETRKVAYFFFFFFRFFFHRRAAIFLLAKRRAWKKRWDSHVAPAEGHLCRVARKNRAGQGARVCHPLRVPGGDYRLSPIYSRSTLPPRFILSFQFERNPRAGFPRKGTYFYNYFDFIVASNRTRLDPRANR